MTQPPSTTPPAASAATPATSTGTSGLPSSASPSRPPPAFSSRPSQPPTSSVSRASAEPFEVLREITATHLRVLDVIERSFDAGPGVPDLDMLRSEIAAVMDRLRQWVAERTTFPPEKLLLPLVCLYDERVMVRAMEPRGEEHWSRLQRADYAPREDGGDLFFEKERELLDRVAPAATSGDPAERQEVILLVTLYRFCLAEGFQGRCSSAPDKLAERRRQLDAALSVLVPAKPAAPKKSAGKSPSWLETLRKVLGIDP